MSRGTSAGDRPRDAGMSLAELLVSMTLMALIGTLVATIAIVSLRTANGLQARNENTTQADLGIAAAGKVLRTAVLPAQLEDRSCTGCGTTAIVTATSTRVIFYANLGSSTIGPSLVTLNVVADARNPGTGMLVQETQPPIALTDGSYTFCSRSSPSCRYTTRVAARGLLWPSPGVLTFYDYEGIAMPGPTVSSTNLARISSVDLVMTVQRRPKDPDFPSRTAVTRVRLPNVEINNTNENVA